MSSFDPKTPLLDITPGDVLSHLSLQARTRSGNAANKDRKNFMAAWGWAGKYLIDLPGKNPFAVDRFAEVRSPRYVPPMSDFWSVYNVAKPGDDQLMLLVLLHLALRRAEVFRMKWGDIDFVSGKVRVYTCKRIGGDREYDELPLTNALMDMFAEKYDMSQSGGSGGYVFVNQVTGRPYVARQRWIGNLCFRAGVKEFGYHAIRHLTASYLAAQGVPVVDIKDILRHRSMLTTQRYLRRLSSLRESIVCLDDMGIVKTPQPTPQKKAPKSYDP